MLVHGASGGVGLAAVQLGRGAGLTVVGTAGSQRGAELVAANGAHHVFDHHDPDHWRQIAHLTGGRGPDIILEMLSNEHLDKDLVAVAARGRIVLVGNRGRVEINPRVAMVREITIKGVFVYAADERETLSIHAAIGAGLAMGTLRPTVGREFALADAPKAHHAVLSPGAYGKIVLVP